MGPPCVLHGDGLIPGFSGGTKWVILLFLPWGCKPFSSLGPCSINGGIGGSVLSSMLIDIVPLCICHAMHSLPGDSYNRLQSASTYGHPQYCLGFVTVYGMDSLGEVVSGWSFPQTLLNTFVYLFLWVFCSPF